MDPDPTPGDRSILFHVQIVTNEHSRRVPRVLRVYGTAFTFKVKGRDDRGMLGVAMWTKLSSSMRSRVKGS